MSTFTKTSTDADPRNHLRVIRGAMSGWGGSSDSSYARNITNQGPDSDDEIWYERRRQRDRDAEKRAYFGVIRPMTDIAPPEDSPRAVIPRDVLYRLLADPCNYIMKYDQDFIEDIISSALIYGTPLFFNSWNCGWTAEEGTAELVRAPPRRPPSNQDWTQTGFFSCLGYKWELVNPDLLPHPWAHFNGPSCLRKATAECDRCGVLRCPCHIHEDLVGYYKRLCNTCYSTNQFSEYTLRVARAESQLLAYTTTEMREQFSKYYYPRTNLRKEIHMFLQVTSLPLFPLMCVGHS